MVVVIAVRARPREVFILDQVVIDPPAGHPILKEPLSKAVRLPKGRVIIAYKCFRRRLFEIYCARIVCEITATLVVLMYRFICFLLNKAGIYCVIFPVRLGVESIFFPLFDLIEDTQSIEVIFLELVVLIEFLSVYMFAHEDAGIIIGGIGLRAVGVAQRKLPLFPDFWDFIEGLFLKDNFLLCLGKAFHSF